MKLLLVAGSGRKSSHTRTLLEAIAAEAKSQKLEVELWDLAEKSLPVYKSGDSDNAKEFIKAVDTADVLVFGSPHYHGSFSGVIKNAIDYLDIPHVKGKKVGLVSNGSNQRKCLQPALALLPVATTLHGRVVSTMIGTYDGDYQEAKGTLKLVEQGVLDRIPGLIEELKG